MNIEDLPKGAIPDEADARDFQAEDIFGALVVDWSQPFKLSDPGNTDQGGSLSCVAHSWSFLHTQLRPKNYSRRDLYSQIFLPQGGASLRSGGSVICSKGQATQDEAPDPKPQTEMNMRDGSGITDEERKSDIEANYFRIDQNNIDAVAWAIKNYGGCVFGVNGTNAGWKNLAEPTPPKSGTTEWAHALYAFGYHMHGTQKCIIAKCSWSDTGVTEHHIKQNYFTSGNTFNAWVLIPREETFNMTVRKVVKADGKTFGVLIDSPNGAQIVYATGEEQWRSWSKADSYKLATVNADGSTNWTADFQLPF